MKTKEQVQQEITDCDVYTLREFMDTVKDGNINSYDGDGYFYDGDKETNLSVWDNRLTWEDIKDYPYVCWYNK